MMDKIIKVGISLYDSNNKFISKVTRIAVNRIRFKFKERTWGKIVKYVYFTHKNSNILVIVFSGFSGGKGASYNYTRKLEEVTTNHLHILDNFGFKEEGSYYLGEDGEYFLPEQIYSLVSNIKAKSKSITKIITLGSSKGGSAALYYGLKLNADYIFLGAPQYYIGNYLLNCSEKLLMGICGDNKPESIDFLNTYLYDTIVESSINNNNLPKIYLHYSKNEHTYWEHIKFMISDLRQCGFMIVEDIAEYSDHSSVGIPFSKFFITEIQKIIDNEK